jgi:hypothetical protein
VTAKQAGLVLGLPSTARQGLGVCSACPDAVERWKAKVLQLYGESDIRRFLLRLARKLAVVMDDEVVEQRVRELVHEVAGG